MDEVRQMNPRYAWILVMGEMEVEVEVDKLQPGWHAQIVRTVDDVARAECVIHIALRGPDKAMNQEQGQPRLKTELKQHDQRYLETYREPAFPAHCS